MPALLPHPAVTLTVNAPELLAALAPLASSYRMPVCWVVSQNNERVAADMISSPHELAWGLPSVASEAESNGLLAGLPLCKSLPGVVAVSEAVSTAAAERFLKAGVTAVCSEHTGRQPRRLRYGLWEFPAGATLTLGSGAMQAWRQRRALGRALNEVAEQGGLLRVAMTAAPLAAPRQVARHFEQALRMLCRERDLGRIRVEPLSALARQLSHRPRPEAARSILRTQAA